MIISGNDKFCIYEVRWPNHNATFEVKIANFQEMFNLIRFLIVETTKDSLFFHINDEMFHRLKFLVIKPPTED